MCKNRMIGLIKKWTFEFTEETRCTRELKFDKKVIIITRTIGNLNKRKYQSRQVETRYQTFRYYVIVPMRRLTVPYYQFPVWNGGTRENILYFFTLIVVLLSPKHVYQLRLTFCEG